MTDAYDAPCELRRIDRQIRREVDTILASQALLRELESQRVAPNDFVIKAAAENSVPEGHPIAGPDNSIWFIRGNHVDQVEPSQAYTWAASNSPVILPIDIADEHNAALVAVITGSEATA